MSLSGQEECDDVFTSGTVILPGVESFGNLQEWPTEKALAKFESVATSTQCGADDNVLLYCGCFPILGANKISNLDSNTVDDTRNVQGVSQGNNTDKASDWTKLRMDIETHIFKSRNTSLVSTSKTCRLINVRLQRKQRVWELTEQMKNKISDIKKLFLEMKSLLSMEGGNRCDLKEQAFWVSRAEHSRTGRDAQNADGSMVTNNNRQRPWMDRFVEIRSELMVYAEILCFLNDWSTELSDTAFTNKKEERRLTESGSVEDAAGKGHG